MLESGSAERWGGSPWAVLEAAGRSAGSEPPASPGGEEGAAESAPAGLALAVLEDLELGVVICDGALRSVRFANPRGRAALQSFGGRPGRLPVALRRALRRDGPGAVRCEPGLPTVAVVAVTPAGSRYVLRARRGRALSPDVLVTITPAGLPASALPQVLGGRLGLTRQQCELIALVRAGRRNHEIARALRLSVGTVRQYLSDLYAILAVHSRAELVTVVDDLMASGLSAAP